jgi:small-conductance mechanosensitive channel
MRVDEELQLSLAFDRQLSSTFDHALSSTLNWFKFSWELMWVFATRAVISSQLSSTVMQLLFSFDWCGEAWVLRKLSLLNSHQHSHQLSCNSCSRLTDAARHECWENSRFSTLINILINCHATLVLVWPMRRGMSVEKTLASQLSTLINILINCHATLVLVWPMRRGMSVEKTLASQLSSGLKL